jgi:hypothetical protein
MPDLILYLPCLTTEFPFFAEDTENIFLIMVTVIQQSNQRFSYNNRLLFNNTSIMYLACKDSSSLLRTWRSGVKDDMMAWGKTRIAQSLPQIFLYISAEGSNQIIRIPQRIGYILNALTEEVRYSLLGTKYVFNSDVISPRVLEQSITIPVSVNIRVFAGPSVRQQQLQNYYILS